MYQKVLKQKPTDVAVLALAANNSSTINGAQNVFDSRRKLKLTKATLDENDVKFTMKQKRALAVNQCLFLGLTLQVMQYLFSQVFFNLQSSLILLKTQTTCSADGAMQEDDGSAEERLSWRIVGANTLAGGI